MTDPTRISDPAVRALAREVSRLTQKVESLERGSRATQLGHSTVDDGSLWFTDAAGIRRVSIGKQIDGKFGWGAVNGGPPPRPTPPQLDSSVNGVTIGWDGQFVGAPPSDFTHVKAYLSPAGASFLPSEGNVVGHLLGNAKLPITPLDAGTGYWCVLIAYNTSGAASEPSIVAGPVQPSAVVATEILDGIVDELALAADAVTAAKIAAGAVGETEIGPEAITTPKIAARAVEALQIAVETILAENIAADQITTEHLKALAVTADKIAANQINAGHLEAGSITADKLSAILVLASQLIAGDPGGWRTEIGDAVTPLLYWNGSETGFALSRDPVTGQSNAYLSGRIEFGNGSQIESDYLDLAEQASSGWQQPKPRQYRTLIWSEPVTQVTAPWLSATGKASLLLCGVLAVNYGGTGAPTITVPAAWGAPVRTVTGGATGSTRMSLYHIPASMAFRSTEAISVSIGSSLSVQLVEYAGTASAALDVAASTTGTGTTASSGTTATTTQGAEVHVALFGSPGAGDAGRSGFSSPTNGFSTLTQGGGYKQHGSAMVVRNATGTGQVSTQMSVARNQPWLGIVATFRAALADPVPPAPPSQTVRLYTRSRGGFSTPWVIDNMGRSYPMGRVPYCSVQLTANFGLAAQTDVWAQSNWSIGDDPYGMASVSTTAGTFSSITIPVTGRYLVNYRTIYAPTTDAIANATCYVAANARDPQNSVARDSRRFMRYGVGDLSPVQAFRPVTLTEGTVLYWGNWSEIGTTVHANVANIPTEITVTFVGSN